MDVATVPLKFVAPPWARQPDVPHIEPCFGIGCELRGSCACYREVECAPGGTTVRATCLRNGSHPGYRPAEEPS